MQESVNITTAGGTIRIDVTSSVENGRLNLDPADSTSGDVLIAVRNAIRAGTALETEDGELALVVPTAPLVYAYVRSES